jgi:hypothetical protein
MKYSSNKIPLFFLFIGIAIIGVGFYSSLNDDPISPKENSLVSTFSVMLGWLLIVMAVFFAFTYNLNAK